MIIRYSNDDSGPGSNWPSFRREDLQINIIGLFA